MPRLLLLPALAACGFFAACGGSGSDRPTTYKMVPPITVQGHTVTRVVILPGAIKTH